MLINKSIFCAIFFTALLLCYLLFEVFGSGPVCTCKCLHVNRHVSIGAFVQKIHTRIYNICSSLIWLAAERKGLFASTLIVRVCISRYLSFRVG